MGEPTSKAAAAAAAAAPAQIEARIRTLQSVVITTTIVVGVLILGGIASVWLGLSKMNDLRIIHEVRPNAVNDPGHQYALGEFLVNLQETDHFVKANVIFYLDEEKYIELARQREPVLRDVVIAVFSSKGIRDVSTLEGKELLKKELKERLTGVLPKGRVTDVRFPQFAIS